MYTFFDLLTQPGVSSCSNNITFNWYGLTTFKQRHLITVFGLIEDGFALVSHMYSPGFSAGTFKRSNLPHTLKGQHCHLLINVLLV